MKHKNIFLASVLLLAVSICSAQRFGSNKPNTHWLQINTDTARVIFAPGMEASAQRVATILHSLHRNTAYSIGSGTRKVNMILQNQTTVPNAYVRMAPFRSELFMTPGQNSFSLGSVRWDDNLATHEYRHVQQLTNFGTGFTKVFSFFLGQEGQLLANGMTVPDYFFEGDAVFQETLVTTQGRGRLPNFFNEYKALWQANKKYDWMRLRNGSLRSLSPDHYQTGYMLVAYGYEKYGPDFWKKVTQDATHFKGVFYSFNNAVKRHSGVSYQQFCKDAMEHFKAISFPNNNSFYNGLQYLTGTKKGNVINYHVPQYTEDGGIVAVKQSYQQVPTFYLLQNGKEQKIRVKDIGLDNYFSYRNGKIIYSGYNINARWGWTEYSDIRVLDIKTGKQETITSRTKYFSPDLSLDGSTIIATHTRPNGSSELHLLDATSGAVKKILPNEAEYFFTQTRFIDNDNAVSAVRRLDGTMALVKINLATGTMEQLTPFSVNVVGYPYIQGGKIYFSMMDGESDKVFALNLADNSISRLTNNDNSVYQPAVNAQGEMVVSVFTNEGQRLAKLPVNSLQPQAVAKANPVTVGETYTPKALQQPGAGFVNDLPVNTYAVKKYSKATGLFNFHSRRPVVAAPEYGYSFFSDNMLNIFNNSLTYTYNENERSHNVEYLATYGAWLPVIYGGVQGSFNRQFTFTSGNTVNFNSATARIGAYIPLSFVSGRSSQNLSFGGSFNAEQLYYNGIGKNILDNRSFNYLSLFFNLSSFSQQAQQHIFPRWGQTLSVGYRSSLQGLGFNKLVATANLYLPGLLRNHNLIINGAFQQRDTLGDIFSNTFPFSRGYTALRTRRMYKIGANYHFPIAYPDFGVGNIFYIQRLRGNVFFDYTNARARLDGLLQNIPAKTVGGELYLDGKIWNALPIGIGVRYNYLLDRDLLSPGTKHIWQIILPVGIIPR